MKKIFLLCIIFCFLSNSYSQIPLSLYTSGGPRYALYYDAYTHCSLDVNVHVGSWTGIGIDTAYSTTINQWIGNFFNKVSGIHYETSILPYVSIPQEFIKKEKKDNTYELYGGYLTFFNDKCLSVVSQYAKSADSTQLYMDVATFDRYTVKKLEFDDIFNCGKQKIQELMEAYRPEGFYPDPKGTTVGNACFGYNCVFVIGSVYHGQAIYKIPFDVVEPYLTDNAYNLFYGYVPFSEHDGTANLNILKSNTEKISHLIREEYVTVSRYYNENAKEYFQVQYDNKYSYDVASDKMDEKAKNVGYVQIQSDDITKKVFIQLMKKKEVTSLKKTLLDCLKEYEEWITEMKSENFKNYKEEEFNDGELNLCYYNKPYWKQSPECEYEILFKYNKRRNEPFIVIHSTNLEANKNVVKEIASGVSTVLKQNFLTGWTIVLQNPIVELQDMISAIEILEQKMK